MSQIYNIYCDESRVDNLQSHKMVIGALFVPKEEKQRITTELKEIFIKNGFNFELKWVKTSDRFTTFYKDIIEYFLKEPFLKFRCIVVDKRKVNLEDFHDNDSELAFFKFYYLMLREKLKDGKEYYVFLDKKPTRDKNRVRALFSYLNSFALWNRSHCAIKHMQSYDSKEIILLQVCDFLTGLVAYEVNQSRKKGIKSEIAVYLKEKMEIRDFERSTLWSEEKFNIFVWDNKYEKNC